MLRQLIAMMEFTDLYVGPELKLSTIHVQISAKDWFRYFDRSIEEGTLKSCMSAASLDKPVRIMCVPSDATDRILYRPLRTTNRPPGELFMSREHSKVLFLSLSTITSDRLLSLLGYRMVYGRIRKQI